MYSHIFYAMGGSEMPNGQNLRPIVYAALQLPDCHGCWMRALGLSRAPND